ncbi:MULTISPECIES: helix-turn-helix domain-containing protein [Bacteroides]|uniref:helix-turn-helix domain-containing protein n=1 Tax=Bacteroides TaxID=816 RepID=UPI001F24FDB4|nr:AraC family transcriptional regulator [Bacteroides pyogenes]MCE9107619.1 AraC family transcriptional regulator [Bacteroides pyogenes]MCF2709711.1 helix-turn-helix transcriptional regulator [Bacteroides pyogenes]MDY5354636.1 AraC family transcriptional regulator [Bacteroides pyogenes]
MPRRDKSSKLHREIVEKVTNYILNNLHEALDLKQLADNANMSSFHFHRIFTRLKGETPHHFIRRCRVEKAVQLIQSGQTLFLNEIAYECGFTTQSLFVKTFRKHYGISPHEFRKQLK